MNSRLEAQSRQLSQNSNLTCSNSTQVQETANNAEVLPCAAGDHFFLRLAAGATPRTGPRVRATRPRSCKHPTLGGLAGTVLSALPHPPSPQCCHSSSGSWERPSCKRTLLSMTSTSALNSRQSPRSWPSGDVRSFLRRQLSNGKPPRAGGDISTANALPAVGRWRCFPVFNSKTTHRPNCCAVEQQLREPPTSTVAPPRSFPTKQWRDHSAWSSSTQTFEESQNEIVEGASPRRTSYTALQRLRKTTAYRRRSRRTNRGTSSHRRYRENWRVHRPWAIMGTVRFLGASSVFVVGTTADHFRPTSKWESRSVVS